MVPPTETMSFSSALEQIKGGAGMTRKAWGGNGVVRLQMPDENSKMTGAYLYIVGHTVQPFTPGQDSILADDWCFAEDK